VRFFLFAAVLPLVALSTSCATRSAAPAASAPALASRPPDEVRRRQTIAVYPFENNAVTARERLDFLREWLPDVVGGQLREAGELRLVERRELVKILQEQKLGASEIASKEGRLRLGRMAGAQTLVFGGFTAIAGELHIDARIVDAESGLVTRSVTARGAVGEARRLGEELAGKVAANLGVEIARRTTAAGVTGDQALRAAELYYEGVALEQQGKKDDAIERYRQALEMNRNDEEARQRLKKLLTGP